jgi:hypothetical protein
MSDLTRVATYVKRTDPTMYRRICCIIGSRRSTQVGAYVELTDPEMFDRILAHR